MLTAFIRGVNVPIVIAIALLTQGCATMHNGRTQEIRVVTDPAGATVEVQCGRAQRSAMTPATIRVPRRAEECSLLLTLPGFASETVLFESRTSPWFWMNFVPIGGGATIGMTRQSDQAFVDFITGAFLGGAGFGIDALTGAMWQWEPASVERTMAPK